MSQSPELSLPDLEKGAEMETGTARKFRLGKDKIDLGRSRTGWRLTRSMRIRWSGERPRQSNRAAVITAAAKGSGASVPDRRLQIVAGIRPDFVLKVGLREGCPMLYSGSEWIPWNVLK